MRLRDPSYEDWLIRQQRLAERREQKDARLRRALGLTRSRAKRRRAVVIRLPPELMAEKHDSRLRVLNVTESLIRHLSTTDSLIKLDWSGVRRIYPGGMLMMLAHLELLLELFPRRVKLVCPRGSLAAQLIRHFDLGTRLGVGADGNTPRDSSVLPWRFATGRDVDGAQLLEHIQTFADRVGSEVPDGLYNALSEATTNVQHHAYPAEHDVPEQMRRWWLFSRTEEPSDGKEGVIYLAFYDVGIGIPASMRACLQGLVEKGSKIVIDALAKFGLSDGLGQDPKLVRLAVEHPRTSTGLPFRGKGLPEMKDFVVKTPGGRMTIISGKAQYSVRAESPDGSSVKCERGILGTLILWNLPLRSKEAMS